jgi:hypothetical protein
MSGRPEAKAVLDQFRAGPSLAARLQIGGGMVDASFIADMIQKLSLDKEMEGRRTGSWRGR